MATPDLTIPKGRDARRVGMLSASLMICADMIGTGVFTSLGFQLLNPFSPFDVLALWLVGGSLALCGSLVYGELATRLPQSGGEYNYLTRIYGRPTGFLAGWISLIAGFAAPIAAGAVALASYLAPLLGISGEGRIACVAAGLVAALSLVHFLELRLVLSFQNVFVLVKLAVVATLIVFGFAVARPVAHSVSFAPTSDTLGHLVSPAFAVSLIFVSFAFSGWNAATYIADEIRDPRRNLPRAMAIGTIAVTALYLLLNGAFLASTPRAELAGHAEVAFIAARRIFGADGGRRIALMISLGLISALSSMIWAGARVAQAMGRRESALAFLAPENSRGRPVAALGVQLAIALAMIATASFTQVIQMIGFLLVLCTSLAVAGLFVLRRRDTAPRLHPVYTRLVTLAALVYLAGNAWILVYLTSNEPRSCAYGVAVLAAGLLVMRFSRSTAPSEVVESVSEAEPSGWVAAS